MGKSVSVDQLVFVTIFSVVVISERRKWMTTTLGLAHMFRSRYRDSKRRRGGNNK